MPDRITRVGPAPLAPPSALFKPPKCNVPLAAGLPTTLYADTFDNRNLPVKSYGVGSGDNWGAVAPPSMSDGVHSWSIFVTGGAGDFAGVVGGRGVGKHTPVSNNVLNASTDTGLLPVHFQVDAVVRVGPDAAIVGTTIVNLNLHMHSGDLIGHLQIQRNAGALEARMILENSGALGPFGAFVAGVDYYLRWEYNSIGAPNVERAKLWRVGAVEPDWAIAGVPFDPIPGNNGNERVVWQFGGALPPVDLTFDLCGIRASAP